jgi:hypothetical protein
MIEAALRRLLPALEARRSLR